MITLDSGGSGSNTSKTLNIGVGGDECHKPNQELEFQALPFSGH